MGGDRSDVYAFGPFRLHPAERVLLRANEPVTLTPKAFDTLVVLVAAAGHLVTKDALLQEVWPDSFVEPGSLARNIHELRRALGETTGENAFIETVPKHGYRFVAPVRSPVEGATQPPSQRVDRPGRRDSGWRQSLTLASIVVVLAAAAVAFTASRHRTAEAIDSLAVLPFVNAGGEADLEYLSDGLTESTINSLSQLDHLRVTPRTTSSRYKGKQIEPQQIAREIGVAAVVTGKVAQRGDTLMVQAELIDALQGSQIWGEQFSRKAADVLTVQEEIARAIAAKLRLNVSGEDYQRLVKQYPTNTDAYRAYLKGRYHWNLRREASLHKAIEYFQQAAQIDPSYALAYSGLADSYTTLGYFSYIPPVEAFPRATAAAHKALEFDSSLAEAHASLAYARLYYDWNWRDAETEFKKALSANPDYATAHHWYSVYLTAMRRYAEAATEIGRAQELDALSLPINTDIGFELYYRGLYDDAVKQLQSTLEMNPDFALAHLWLGRAYQEQRRFAQARAEFKRVEAVFQRWPVAMAASGHVAAQSGDRVQAENILRGLLDMSREKYVTAYGVALVYAALGESDRAFAWLDRAFQERSHWLVWLDLDPRWSALRADPRFGRLVQRLGLPQPVPATAP